MKVILRPKRTGRTEELIRLCAEAEARGEVSYIICSNHQEAYRIAKVAEELDLVIGFPVTMVEFFTREYHAPNIRNFFIDNLDHILQSMTSVTIQAVTMEESE